MGNAVAPWVRVLIVVVATAACAAIAKKFTGEFLPSDPREAILFQNALLLVVLGSALLERHFTRPADSVVNSVMGLVTLLSVKGIAPNLPWNLAAGYCAIVLVLSVTCVTVSSGPDLTGWREKVASFTYRPAVVFGRSRVLFSVVFLSALWFFYDTQDPITLALVVFWGLFLSLWPLRVPELLTAWFSRDLPESIETGEIVRVDSPNIVRVALNGDAPWNHEAPQVALLPNGQAYWVQPLFSQFQDGKLLATGLVTDLAANARQSRTNCVVPPNEDEDPPNSEEICGALGGGENAVLRGVVVEDSAIGAIKFETLDSESCYDGMLVWSNVAGEKVYYQIVSGETKEESFSSDKHGYQVATATQLGKLDAESGFTKVDWLPAMNSPVFSANDQSALTATAVGENDFKLGVVPRTNIDVGGPFSVDFNHHTAILGVTGSGKTELAFDLIRHAVGQGLKVVCIDLTSHYAGRLQDLNPADLSIEGPTATELSQKLFDVETGQYGAGKEKKALEDFAEEIREQVGNAIENFLTQADGPSVGLIQLEEISNTRATLWITELYMTCLLRFARERLGDSPPTLIVVEEAHTVMPEASTMGLGDFDSKGLVGKIAQIALQGRKYGVGLLVLAQRTATVSKTVLTQCNTIISFSCYDDTSLGFLKNIFGREHVAIIPNLPRLHAIAFGKWVRSERPLIFEVPFDEAKVNPDISLPEPEGEPPDEIPF